jgi:hypothetical protein
VITAHHGFGEELLPALIASGGTALSATALLARAKLEGFARWLRRR